MIDSHQSMVAYLFQYTIVKGKFWNNVSCGECLAKFSSVTLLRKEQKKTKGIKFYGMQYFNYFA